MRVILLVGTPTDLDLSHALYANNLVDLGHEVWVGDVNALAADGLDIRCPAVRVATRLLPYAAPPGAPRSRGFGDVDLVWVLNQPHPTIAAEVWQLLWRLNRAVPFVNDVTGLLMLNNKTNLPLLVPAEHLPGTLVSNDFDDLWARYSAGASRPWIVKPPNGGCGADVFVLEPGSTNNKALVQSMTGNAAADSAITRGCLNGLRARYCVLQEFVSQAVEKRVVLVGGRPVVQQAKTIASGDHRGNVSQSAAFALSELDDTEHRLAERVGERLSSYGIRFAGIDIAYPAVFEVNLVNPGGLPAFPRLGLPDSATQPYVAQLVASALQ